MFIVYMFAMAFLLINMFIAVINDAYQEVSKDETKYSYDKEMVDHIWNKLMNIWNKIVSTGDVMVDTS